MEIKENNEFESLKNQWENIYYKVYENNFINEPTDKNKRDITNFMAFLINVPEKYNLKFCDFLYNKIELPNVVACILFASMNDIKNFDINKKYKILADETKYTMKPLNMLKTICKIYDIKIKENRTLFGKVKLKLEFPKDFRNRLHLELNEQVNKNDIEMNTLPGDYDDFVDWWSHCDEEKIQENMTLFGAYQIMWFYNEMCNGGFEQFWEFAENSHWDLDKTKEMFHLLLPKEFYDLFETALNAHKKAIDCEKFNIEFDSIKMEKEVLPKLASKIMKIVRNRQ
jgi:hypothetical protein